MLRAACSKPDAAGLQRLVGPVGEQMGAAGALTEGRRGAAFHHCKAVAEALGGLSWVVYTGPGCGVDPAVRVPHLLVPGLASTDSHRPERAGGHMLAGLQGSCGSKISKHKI